MAGPEAVFESSYARRDNISAGHEPDRDHGGSL
jgi:hypothetical protein